MIQDNDRDTSGAPKKGKARPSRRKFGLQVPVELAGDLRALAELKGKVENVRVGRLMAVAVSSVIEAIAGYCAQRVLARCDERTLQIKDKDEQILRKIIDPKSQAPFRDALRTSLRTFAKMHGRETPLGGAVPLPDGFDEARTIRNRLSHPRTLEDLTITPEQYQVLAETAEWIGKISQWIGTCEVELIEETKDQIHHETQKRIALLRRGSKNKDSNSRVV